MEINKCLKFLYMFVFWSSSINFDIPYSEKFGKNRWKKISAENFGKWSAKSLLILTTNLDDFSSENCWWFVHYKLYGSKLYVFIQICIYQCKSISENLKHAMCQTMIYGISISLYGMPSLPLTHQYKYPKTELNLLVTMVTLMYW